MLRRYCWLSNNAINADSKKRRAFVAPLSTAGYGKRYVKKLNKEDKDNESEFEIHN